MGDTLLATTKESRSRSLLLMTLSVQFMLWVHFQIANWGYYSCSQGGNNHFVAN